MKTLKISRDFTNSLIYFPIFTHIPWPQNSHVLIVQYYSLRCKVSLVKCFHCYAFIFCYVHAIIELYLCFQIISIIIFVCFVYTWEIVLYTNIIDVCLEVVKQFSNLKISIAHWTSADVHTWTNIFL